MTVRVGSAEVEVLPARNTGLRIARVTVGTKTVAIYDPSVLRFLAIAGMFATAWYCRNRRALAV